VSDLELAGLEARYDDNAVVRGLNLTVKRGEFVALLGPSGCGKTTTLRMIAGFVPPFAGAIRLAGRVLNDIPAHKRNIGYVFQNYALFPHLTVADNVAFGLRMRHVAAAELARRVTTALDLVGLGEYAARFPAQLSGGQQQRVALARALVIEPDLLLLDEPLSNLDAGLRGEMRAEIRALQQRLSITTLFVTHDQSEALAMSDRIAVMHQGALVEVASPRALCDAPAADFTARFLGARTVLDGAIQQDGAQRRFVTKGGLSCDMRADDPAATRLVLRAARLAIAPADASANARLVAPARVRQVIYLGDDLDVDLEAAGERLRAIVPSGTSIPPVGAACTVVAGDQAVSWLTQS
jgi:putative spermidine/putrescine transport system ATP-binding protein